MKLKIVKKKEYRKASHGTMKLYNCKREGVTGDPRCIAGGKYTDGQSKDTDALTLVEYHLTHQLAEGQKFPVYT